MRETLSEKMKQIPETLADAFAGAIVYGQNLSESLIRLAQDIMYTVIRAWLLKSIFGGIFGGGFSLGATSWGVGVGASGSMPAMASGGPVSAGKTYLVGEEGPELFSPNTGGQIIPNGATAGSVEVNVYNQTGERMNARSESRIDGVKTIIDMWLTGIGNNVSGSRDVVRGLAR